MRTAQLKGLRAAETCFCPSVEATFPSCIVPQLPSTDNAVQLLRSQFNTPVWRKGKIDNGEIKRTFANACNLLILVTTTIIQ